MKITKEGYAVVEWDMLLSKDVEESGRLDVAEGFLEPLRVFIPQGGVVVDAGACIGDHTVTYAEMVGKLGKVYAFEPPGPALRCLLYNVRDLPQVEVHGRALGDVVHLATLQTDGHNLGASRLVGDANGGVVVRPLDAVLPSLTRLDFVKIDVEGYEPYVLSGAQTLLSKFRPVMLIEINKDMLGRNGLTEQDVLKHVDALGGYWRSKSTRHEYDLLCVPEEKRVKEVEEKLGLG
jgi:FkbM family methyltransferase